MNLDQFNVPADVRRLLDDEALADVVAQFHPGGECRVCGRPLGEQGRFSLSVAENGVLATAIPFHAPCMSSHGAHPDFLGIPAGTYQHLPVGIPMIDVSGTPVLTPVLCVNPSVDMVTLTHDPATGTYQDPRVPSLTGQGWVRCDDPAGVRFDPNSPPVGTLTPAGAPGQWMVSTTLGDWAVDLDSPALADRVAALSGMYVMAFFHTQVSALPSLPDPLAALGAAVVGEPALMGRVAIPR